MRDVTAQVRRLIKHGELRLNETREGGWYNRRFTDTAPGTWKVMAVQYRYGEGKVHKLVSPKKEDERAALIITPMRCSPKPTPLREAHAG